MLSFYTVNHIFKYNTKAFTILGIGSRVNKLQGVRLDLEVSGSGYCVGALKIITLNSTLAHRA